MRRAVGFLLLLIAALVPPSAFAGGKNLRVLFVGNSLTYYNDLPATFATLYRATEPGTRVDTEMLAQGGGKLRERISDGQLASLLAREHYDVVVLQDIGGWPECPREFPGCEDAPVALREAVNLVRSHGVRALWFSTWQPHPAAQQALSARTTALSRDLRLDTVDVGAAMQRVPAKLRAQLLGKDGHPAPPGTWLTAAMLVRAIATAPLPERSPPRSCGTDWTGHLTATKPASAQRRGKRQCHVLGNAQWRAVRAAVVQ